MQIKNNPIIVSLITRCERISNLPTVLDTIYSQTMSPNKVVLNLAYDEHVPDIVQEYFEGKMADQVSANQVIYLNAA